VGCLPEFNSTVSSPVHFVARDQDPGNVIHGMRVIDSSTQGVLYQSCGRNLDAWIHIAPGTYNFTVESLYTCTEPPPGSAEGVQIGPVTVNWWRRIVCQSREHSSSPNWEASKILRH
jgi:hypothetical protein